MATASLKGVLLAESEKYEMVESNVYFPPDSINWQYFIKSGEKFTSPLIGEAVFYDILVKGSEEKNAAWSFPEPKPVTVPDLFWVWKIV